MTSNELKLIEDRTYGALESWERIGSPSDADDWAAGDGDQLLSDALNLLTEVKRLGEFPK